MSFARDAVNVDALARALTPYHPYPRDFPPGLPFVLNGQTLRNATSLTLTTDLGDFDLLAEPSGIDSFEGLYERATVFEVDGRGIRVASLDDLAMMKRAANRPKDQIHLLMIEALRQIQAQIKEP